MGSYQAEIDRMREVQIVLKLDLQDKILEISEFDEKMSTFRNLEEQLSIQKGKEDEWKIRCEDLDNELKNTKEELSTLHTNNEEHVRRYQDDIRAIMKENQSLKLQLASEKGKHCAIAENLAKAKDDFQSIMTNLRLEIKTLERKNCELVHDLNVLKKKSPNKPIAPSTQIVKRDSRLQKSTKIFPFSFDERDKLAN